MGPGYLLDTNIVIYYLDGVLDPRGKIFVANAIATGGRVSVISKIELLSWNPPGGSNIDSIQSFVDDAIVLTLDDTVIKNTVSLRRTIKKIKLPNAITAATAICFNLNLITRDISDFSAIGGLKVIDPFDL